MRLTIIGCSGSYPGPDSAASCYLLEAERDGRTWRILLDLGSGALGPLHRHVDPRSIDAVFLSHLHADHCLDMCGFYVLQRYHPEGPQPRVPVWGPDDTSERLAAAYDLPGETGMTEEFDFNPYPTGAVEVGPFSVEAVPVAHPVSAYALRVTADGSGTLVYTGDTGPCSAIDDLANGADLLLAEASFLEGEDNPPNLHLTGREAGALAVKGSVGRLVLTHIPPWYDAETTLAEARTLYDGASELAVPGATYDL